MPFIFSIWFLGLATALSGGFYSSIGLLLVFVSFALWTFSVWQRSQSAQSVSRLHPYFSGSAQVFASETPMTASVRRKKVSLVLISMVVCQLGLMGWWLVHMTHYEYSIGLIVGCAGLCALAGIVWSLHSVVGWWLQLATFGFFNLVLLSSAFHQNNLRIDILVFQTDSATALLQGHNPYELTFPNITEQGDASPEYGEGMSVNRRLQFGYVYLPLTLFAVVPGHLLGDFRFSYIAAVLFSALALFGWRVRGEGALLGALFLWSPLSILIFRGYSEYFVAATLCLILLCAHRNARWLPLACGVFLASKQYSVLALPLLWFLVPVWAQQPQAKLRNGDEALTPPQLWRNFVALCTQSLAVCAVISLPVALWNWPAFRYSSLQLQFLQPFRADSLSLLALVERAGGGQLAWWLPFLLFVAATAFALQTLPARCSSFFLGVAWVFMVFFFFNKQAFANYYYFVVVAMSCAVVSLIQEEKVALAKKANDPLSTSSVTT